MSCVCVVSLVKTGTRKPLVKLTACHQQVTGEPLITEGKGFWKIPSENQRRECILGTLNYLICKTLEKLKLDLILSYVLNIGKIMVGFTI